MGLRAPFVPPSSLIPRTLRRPQRIPRHRMQRIHQPLPVVAIVGRPNVGKSTFFNRLTRQRRAVVHPTPGVTRDRNYGRAEYKNRPFLLVDTGGFEPETSSQLLIQMREQTLMAVEEADVVIFLADVRENEHPADDEIVAILRRKKRPIFLAVNKCDSPRLETEAFALARFGFDRIYPVSAVHGTGLLDLLDDIVDALPRPSEATATASDIIHVAIVGRQNVGKSTLVNRLLGQERVIANATPGTTRDAIDTYLEHEGATYCLIDTAGIRRRGRIERGIEHLSVVSAILALQRCDVAILVIDIAAGVQQQDTHIAGIIQEEGRPCIIAMNKWDAVADKEAAYGEAIRKVREDFKFLPHALIVSISGLTGQRCHRLWGLIQHCARQAHREIPTAEVNRVLQAALERVTPPVFRGRILQIKYALQTGTNPPSFTLFVNDPELVHFSYRRYLINRLREAFGFEGTPIRLFFRRKSPPRGWESEARAAHETAPATPDAESAAEPVLGNGVYAVDDGRDWEKDLPSDDDGWLEGEFEPDLDGDEDEEEN